MTPSNQSSGISFVSQIVLCSGRSRLEARSGSALKSSAFMLSLPEAFPWYRDLMALLVVRINVFVGGSISPPRSFSACWTSGSVMGGGRFRTPSKCSAHQASCCDSVVKS